MKIFTTLLLTGFLAFSLHAQKPSGSVALTSFNAVPRGAQVLLTWNPEKHGVVTYQLEKSKNGNDYVAFSEVQGAMTITEFFETDFQPYQGLSYYRLRLNNADGTVSYSNVVPVKYNEKGEPVSPVAAEADASGTTASPEQSVLVIVRNAAGEEFYSKVEVESNGNPVECKDPDPELSKGTYTIVGCSEQDLYCKQILVK
jgi:hypothetical protein